MKGYRPTLLIVDDDRAIREALDCLFSYAGYAVRVADRWSLSAFSTHGRYARCHDL